MRTLILLLLAAVLCGCHANKETTASHHTDSLSVIKTRDFAVRHDSMFISSCFEADSVAVTIIKPDSTCIYIKARNVNNKRFVQHQTNTQRETMTTDSAYVETHTVGTTKTSKPIDNPVKATLILIILITITYTIARLCRH